MRRRRHPLPMRGSLRRFAVVGLVATVVDVALLAALAEGFGWPLALADMAALAVAATWSYTANRTVTFADDPYVRWARLPGAFVAAAVLAGLVDLGTLLALVAVADPVTSRGLVVLKLGAVAAAAMVRLGAYRWVLFTTVRREQVRRVERPPAPGSARLTVVVPAYREAKGIAATVRSLRDEVGPSLDDEILASGGLEVVVVDDGSGDGTAEAAVAAGADRVVTLDRNRGKGAAVRAGVLAASGRVVSFTDADLSYPPDQLLELMREVEAGWDVVVGSRRHTGTTTLVRARRLREVGGRVINLLTWAVLLGQYRDTQCGLKAFRSDVARLIFSRARVDGFAFDVEVFHLVERYRLSLTEVPVRLTSSPRSSVRVVPDGARLVRDLFRVRRWARQGRYDVDSAELGTLGRPDLPLG